MPLEDQIRRTRAQTILHPNGSLSRGRLRGHLWAGLGACHRGSSLSRGRLRGHLWAGLGAHSELDRHLRGVHSVGLARALVGWELVVCLEEGRLGLRWAGLTSHLLGVMALDLLGVAGGLVGGSDRMSVASRVVCVRNPEPGSRWSHTCLCRSMDPR